MVVVSDIVLMLRITLIGLASIHRRDTLSDEKCNEHVADAYGFADIGCTLARRTTKTAISRIWITGRNMVNDTDPYLPDERRGVA